VVLALNNVSNRFRIENQFDDALRLVQRGLEIARNAPDLRAQLGGLFIGLGRIHRDRGAIDEALDAYGQAVTTLDPGSQPKREATYDRTFALAMIDRAETLAGESRVSAGRSDEAIALFRRAFAIADQNAHRDANDADSRSLLSTGGRPLAELLRDESGGEDRVGSEPHDALIALADHHVAHGDPRRALEACDGLLKGIAAAGSRPDNGFETPRRSRIYMRRSRTSSAKAIRRGAPRRWRRGAGNCGRRGTAGCPAIPSSWRGYQPRAWISCSSVT
jgi:tetratricopeptide (TPR) repeat protein